MAKPLTDKEMEKPLNTERCESLNMNTERCEFKNNWNVLCMEHLKERQKKLNDQIEKVKIVWIEYITNGSLSSSLPLNSFENWRK